MSHGRPPLNGKFISSLSSANPPSTRKSSTRSHASVGSVSNSIPEFFLNGEHSQRVPQSGSSVVTVVVIFLVIIAVFLACMIYMCRMKTRKRKILEETRKKISEGVITAGSVCSSKTTTVTSKPKSRTGRRYRHSLDESELKTFKCKGPLVMQAKLRGEVKHALDNSLSRSFHDPLRYDPEHNEIVLIGTDVDRIIGASLYGGSRELASTTEGPLNKTKGKSIISGSRECVTQSDAQFSKETMKWPVLKKGLPGSAEKDTFSINLKTQVSGSRETLQPSFDSGGSMPISSTAEERVRTSPEPQQLEASAEHRKKSPLEKKRLTMTAAAGRMQKERKVTVSKHKARTDASEKKATTMKVGGVDASKLENVLFKTCIDWSYSVPKKKKKKKIQTKIASVHPTQEDGDETAAPPVKRPNKRSPLFTSDRNSGKERYYPDGCDD